MKATRKRLIAVTAGVLALGGVLAGCNSNSKIAQPFNDAPVSHGIKGAAEIGNMPDGFSNWAEKCDDHGNRVFVIFHSDGSYGSIFAMKDPTCGK